MVLFCFLQGDELDQHAGLPMAPLGMKGAYPYDVECDKAGPRNFLGYAINAGKITFLPKYFFRYI